MENTTMESEMEKLVPPDEQPLVNEARMNMEAVTKYALVALVVAALLVMALVGTEEDVSASKRATGRPPSKAIDSNSRVVSPQEMWLEEKGSPWEEKYVTQTSQKEVYKCSDPQGLYPTGEFTFVNATHYGTPFSAYPLHKETSCTPLTSNTSQYKFCDKSKDAEGQMLACKDGSVDTVLLKEGGRVGQDCATYELVSEYMGGAVDLDSPELNDICGQVGRGRQAAPTLPPGNP